MGVCTKFYTAESFSFTEIKLILEKELKVLVEIDSDADYARFFFKENEENRTLHISLNTYDFDKEKLHSSFDLGAWGESVEIMKSVAKYIGGWLLETDSDGKDKAYYVPKTESIERSNSSLLYEAVASKFNYKNTEMLVKFIQENKELINKLNFGL